MITWARVDLPEPLGPITAWTSPDRTVRSTPRRISRPPVTPARRPSISSTATSDHHHHVVAVDDDLVGRHRLGGRKGERLARLQRELAAVLPALDRLLAPVDLALGQGDVGVRARV